MHACVHKHKMTHKWLIHYYIKSLWPWAAGAIFQESSVLSFSAGNVERMAITVHDSIMRWLAAPNWPWTHKVNIRLTHKRRDLNKKTKTVDISTGAGNGISDYKSFGVLTAELHQSTRFAPSYICPTWNFSAKKYQRSWLSNGVHSIVVADIKLTLL